MKKCECKQLECKRHGMTEHALRGIRWRCKKCGYEGVDRRRKKIKADLVAYHGGKCVRCGYSKSVVALTFHHRDPAEKEFKISSSNFIGWDKVLEESKKCDLLCLNCHAEIHFVKDVLP